MIAMRRIVLTAVSFSLAMIVGGRTLQAQTCVPIVGGLTDGQASVLNRSYWWDRDGPGPLRGRLVVAGNGSNIGASSSSNIAVYNQDDGRWEGLGGGLLPSNPGQVQAMATAPNGDLIVGGSFTHAGGLPASRIAIWDGEDWTPLAGGLSNTVRAIAVMPNGDIIAAGEFLTAGGISAPRIARWDGSAWSPLGSGIHDGVVRALAVTDSGDLIAAGQFTLAGGQPAQSIARWNGAAWSPLGGGLPFAHVYALLPTPGGGVIAAGSISSAGGEIARNIVHWTGDRWERLADAGSGSIRCLWRRDDGAILAGGDFENIDGTLINRIALRTETGWTSVGPELVGTIHSICTNDTGEIIISGDVRGGECTASALLRGDGLRWRAVLGGVDWSVYTVLPVSETEIYIGGEFDYVDDACARRIARWDGNAWHAMGPGLGAPGESPRVDDLLRLPNGDIIAVGRFWRAGSVQVNCVARWDGHAWHALGGGVSRTDGDPSVRQVAQLPNGNIVIFGDFTHAGGTPASKLARWDGTAWHGMGDPLASTPNPSEMLVMPNGELIIAGGLRSAAPGAFEGIARWDGTNWSAVGSPAPRGSVAGLALAPSGDLIATGSFSVGSTVRNAGRWDGAQWRPLGLFQNSQFATVGKVAVTAAGTILAYGGTSPTELYRYDGMHWTRLTAANIRFPYDLVSIPGTEDIFLAARHPLIDGARATHSLARLRLPEDGFFLHDQPPAAQTICFNDALRLEVVTSEGGSSVSYQWRTAAGPINPAANPSAATSVLRVPPPHSPSAVYTCDITHSCGTTRTPEYRVTTTNTPSVCCRADWDGSGTVDGADLFGFLNDWQAGNADIDRSGGTDGDDVVDFFTRWLARC